MKQEFRRDCTLAVYGPGTHSRAFGHRCFEHWKCMQASSVTIGILDRRSASFSACVLLSRAFASALLRSRWRRALVHLACSPSQVQCCTLADHGPGAHSRAFASALLPPLAARACSPSQVQCCTLADHSPENRPSLRIPKRNRPHIHGVCFVLESGSVLLSRAFGHGFFASTGRRHGLT